MDQSPNRPTEALGPEDLQRFVYACAHERHSPTTRRVIDAASYGWVHRFVHDHEDHPDARPDRPDWLDPHDADPDRISQYFGRVALRLRDTAAHEYAAELERYFQHLAERRRPWPGG